jgi:hypothetical protein
MKKIASFLAAALVSAPAFAQSTTPLAIWALPPAGTVSTDDLIMLDVVNPASPTGYSTKKATLGLLTALSGGGIQPTLQLPINLNAKTAVAVIGAVTGEWTYVAGGTLTATGAESVTFEYGTQASTPCDTGTTSVGTFWFSPQAPTVPLNVLWTIPASNQLCAYLSNTAPVTGSLSFTQQ